MLSRILFVVLCLLPYSVLAQDTKEMRGVYWRWLLEWKDDTDSGIDYTIEGFNETGLFQRWRGSYGERIDENGRPPDITLSAFGFDSIPKFDTDGDWDIDVDDLNIVRNEFGTISVEHDLTGDGVVDVADLNKVRNDFGLDLFRIKPFPWKPANDGVGLYLWQAGEVFEDCIVLRDVRSYEPNHVVPCQAESVPEPSTLAIAGMALMALSRRIWSRCRPNSRCTRCQVRPRA